MTMLASLLDLGTRWWWRAVGREVDLAGQHAWLDAPMSDVAWVADGWLESHARAIGGSTHEGSGLLGSITDLEAPGFRPADLVPAIADFYEHTSDWRIEVWSGWSWWARLPGSLVERWFGRRVGQLAIPTDPLAVARGMDSRVTVLTDASGSRRGAGWHRTLRTTGDVVFSGFYGVRRRPGADHPSVHVVFPLEHGNVQVFLRPEVTPDGGLVLRSTRGDFGDDGAYVVVRHGRRTWAARVPLHEVFHVHLDAEGVLRTDHELRLGPARAVALHYRLERHG
ncbi:MAG: hypothetical protein P1U38_16260 [Aeromicrobium sp.]|uniref:hypothetical protein n=1 Tax=Aeromicrobium sp. TaxID=1871063 RepID=UPI00261A862B|nr:hypothetical protein [Aeromicrobium sp.]MDF1706322.1 hypothetical protein [Aeromicrobium sp.]